MFNIKDDNRDKYMLTGSLAKQGYDWWWHSFTGVNAKGEEKAFFIEYYLCNPKFGEDEPIIASKDFPDFKGRTKPSYMMVKAGCWGENHAQLHRYFGWNKVFVGKNAPYYVTAGDCYASETYLSGSVKVSKAEAEAHPEWLSDAGVMEWNLHIKKDIAYNVGYGANTFFREIKAFEMYWHAQGMKSLYSGYVIFNGVRYEVVPEKSYGYADKNWGKNFTSPWVWLSSNFLFSKMSRKQLENSVFDIGGGKPRVFGLPLNRKLLGSFFYEGEEQEYNFSKIWQLPRTKFSSKETKAAVYWHVCQENKDSVIDVKIRCLKKDMLLVNYVAPDGSKKHNRLWNGGTGTGTIKFYKKEEIGLVLVDDIKVTHVGCEYGEYC